jgi:hypothetical protein
LLWELVEGQGGAGLDEEEDWLDTCASGWGKYLSRTSLFCFSSSILILAQRTALSWSLSLTWASSITIFVWAAASSFSRISIERSDAEVGIEPCFFLVAGLGGSLVVDEDLQLGTAAGWSGFSWSRGRAGPEVWEGVGVGLDAIEGAANTGGCSVGTPEEVATAWESPEPVETKDIDVCKPGIEEGIDGDTEDTKGEEAGWELLELECWTAMEDLDWVDNPDAEWEVLNDGEGREDTGSSFLQFLLWSFRQHLWKNFWQSGHCEGLDLVLKIVKQDWQELMEELGKEVAPGFPMPLAASLKCFTANFLDFAMSLNLLMVTF